MFLKRVAHLPVVLVAALVTVSFTIPYQAVDSMPTAFHIKRSRDASQIIYKVNLDEHGHLDAEDPILAYWYRFKDDGRIEPITWIQKQFSYGLVFSEVTQHSARFYFAAYDKRSFQLRRENGRYLVFSEVDGIPMELDYIYVHFNGGTDWLPTVEYVKMFTRDTSSLQLVSTTIKP